MITGNEPVLPSGLTGKEPALGGERRQEFRFSTDLENSLAGLDNPSPNCPCIIIPAGRRSMLIVPEWGITAEEIRRRINELIAECECNPVEGRHSPPCVFANDHDSR